MNENENERADLTMSQMICISHLLMNWLKEFFSGMKNHFELIYMHVTTQKLKICSFDLFHFVHSFVFCIYLIFFFHQISFHHRQTMSIKSDKNDWYCYILYLNTWWKAKRDRQQSDMHISIYCFLLSSLSKKKELKLFPSLFWVLLCFFLFI